MAKRKRKSTRRPSAKQVAARRKFAAMARARAKAARHTTRTRKGSTVATRKRRRASNPKRRRRNPMASVRRASGRAVSRRAFHRAGFRRNPHRRRRNPFGGGIVGEIAQLGKVTVAVMAGGALARTVSGMIPLSSPDPKTNALMNVAKGAAIAVLIKRFGRRVVSADLADALAVGVLLGPLRDGITTMVPGTASFLSGGPIGFPSFPGVASYPRLMASYPSYGGGDEGEGTMGSYASEVYG